MYVKRFLHFYRANYCICTIRSYSTNNLLDVLATMPNDKIIDPRRQRKAFSKKKAYPSPFSVYLQVIGSGAFGTNDSLYVFTEHNRYLFNCGEGTQRLAHEHKIKLSKLEHIFITRKTWKHIGGLPGLSLTLQDVGIPSLTLHGPEGLDDLYSATKRFVIMKEMNVKMASCTPSDYFEDNVMSVKYVHLSPQEHNVKSPIGGPSAKKPKLNDTNVQDHEEFLLDDTDYYIQNKKRNENSNNSSNKTNNIGDKPKSSTLGNDTAKEIPVPRELHRKTVSYICTLKKRTGTLDLEKCVEFGVKPGPLLGKLKNGEDVVLPDGKIVLSKDVKTPDEPGPVFIVLEVPEISYLKESEFSSHFDNGENPTEDIPVVVVHYTPPDVVRNPRYQKFMKMFGQSTQHLFLNSNNSCLGSEAVHRTQHKLHLLDPHIFPMLKDVSIPAVWNESPPGQKEDSPAMLKAVEELKNKFQTITHMEGSCKGDGTLEVDSEQQLQVFGVKSLTKYHLRPCKPDRIDRSAEPKLNIKQYVEEAMSTDGFTESLDKLRQIADRVHHTLEYPKILFLGTGSCIPNKTRNTSGIVLNIDDHRSMLLDCGEGTLNQMVRFYGPKKVNSILKGIKAIYVSHLHADHHIGLIGVLQARRQAFQDSETPSSETPPEPVYLLAPGQIMSWLSVYDQQFEKIMGDFTLIPNQDLLYNKENLSSDMTSAVLANIGVERISTCYVTHCPNAFGVAVHLDAANKITYSGDTIPCDELVELGRGSTVLMHEATLEDSLEQEARLKMHSTTSQALDVARRMGARHTLLTHFSQRYARLPRLMDHLLNDNHQVGIAFDNMHISLSDLRLLPHMYAPLQLMFSEHCLELEQKAEARDRKKLIRERQSSRSSSPVNI